MLPRHLTTYINQQSLQQS